MAEGSTGMVTVFSLAGTGLAARVRRGACLIWARVLLSPAEASVLLGQVFGRKSAVARRAAPLDHQLGLHLGTLAQIREGAVGPVFDAGQVVDGVAHGAAVDAFLCRDGTYADGAFALLHDQRVGQARSECGVGRQGRHNRSGGLQAGIRIRRRVWRGNAVGRHS